MTVPDPLPETRLGSSNFTVDHYLVRDGRYGSGYPNNDPFDLDAPYQRGSVWSPEQQRNLIKSFIMGLPVGTIIVANLPYRKGAHSHRIVDGKQRIEAIRAFFDDHLTVPGWWFEDADLVDEAWRTEDVSCTQLSRRGRARIGHSSMPSFTFEPESVINDNPDYDKNDPESKRYIWSRRTDEEILQAEAELYLAVNFGGVAQTDEDKARAKEIAR